MLTLIIFSFFYAVFGHLLLSLKASKTVGKYTCLADHEHSLGLLSVSRRKLLQDQINFEYRQLPVSMTHHNKTIMFVHTGSDAIVSQISRHL